MLIRSFMSGSCQPREGRRTGCLRCLHCSRAEGEAYPQPEIQTLKVFGGPCSTALVGKPGSSGLSVEQRKRLTIAVELVANPSIIFMDEPTSGQRPSLACLMQESTLAPHMCFWEIFFVLRDLVHTASSLFCCVPAPPWQQASGLRRRRV